MFDDQHDYQASVGSNVLVRKPARMRVTLSATAGILSALAPLLTKETGSILSEHRQAFERQELARKSTCPNVTCPDLEVSHLDCKFSFLCGLGTGVIAALALVKISDRRVVSQ